MAFTSGSTAPDPKKARATAERALLDALGQLGLTGFRLAEAAVKPWSQLEEEQSRPDGSDLVGVAELAEILRVSKQRVSEFAGMEQFPKLPRIAQGRPGMGPGVNGQLPRL